MGLVPDGDNVRVNADGAQGLDRVLRRLRFHFARNGQIRHQRHMDEACVARAKLPFQLANRLQIRGGLDIARHAADELPLGYKQRLALACSLMHEPDILFLDEPTSGVDPLTRREFWLHINSMVDKGVTVMVTTHFMDEAEYCDRIGLVYHGKLIASGTPDALKAQAADDSQTDPTMEQAFITLINRWDKENSHGQ